MQSSGSSSSRLGDEEASQPRQEVDEGGRFAAIAVVVFDYFFLGLFFVHALPWMVAYGIGCRLLRIVTCGCVRDPMEGPDYLEDGRVNAIRWLWSLYLNYGSTASAVVATIAARAFANSTSASFGIGVGYVSWFGSIAVLATINFLGECRAGKHARDKFSERSWLGSALLSVFSVPAEVRGSQAFVDVLIAASLLPAIVVGFLAFWFAKPKYGLRCTPKVDNPDTLCNTVGGRNVCCRVVNAKYDVGRFIPHLISYVVAGYAAATLLVRLLVARHSTRGGDVELVLYSRRSASNAQSSTTALPRLSTRTGIPLPSPSFSGYFTPTALKGTTRGESAADDEAPVQA